jgi:hypothetical protein
MKNKIPEIVGFIFWSSLFLILLYIIFDSYEKPEKGYKMLPSDKEIKIIEGL